MKIATTQTVGEIAAQYPSSIGVFEENKIDYCCGGSRGVKEACALAGVPVEDVLAAVEKRIEEFPAGLEGPISWRNKTMGDLIDHILDKHHAYTRKQTLRLRDLSSKVKAAHGAHHPELMEIDDIVQLMGEELEGHMAKEEEQVFPYLKAVEKAGGKKERIPDPFSGGPLDQHPLKVLMWEHGMTGEEWISLHQLTRDFTVPEDACPSYRAFYDGLRELEADLHRHVHLENNVLFPMAAGILD